MGFKEYSDELVYTDEYFELSGNYTKYKPGCDMTFQINYNKFGNIDKKKEKFLLYVCNKSAIARTKCIEFSFIIQKS